MAGNQPDKLNQAKLIQLEKNQLKLQQEFAALRFFEAQKNNGVQTYNNTELVKEIEALKQKISQIETVVSRPTIIPADAYPHLIVEQPPPLLDLPISKIIDIYHETPQILEVYCQRVSLLTDQQDVLERNNVGNFWVMQLKNQGFYLFPRPESFSRFSSLASFAQLFQATNEVSVDNYQFTLQAPAKLDLLKIDEKWKLLKPGKIIFGQCPLEYAWQLEISRVRMEYEKFNKLLDARGSAGLDFTLISQYWQQSLMQKYGELVTLAINTCIPIAYAIYKGPMLVPCQILLGSNPLVVPGWDRGVPWETSIYSQSHSKFNTDYLRTPGDHPLLPNQIYLRESKGQTHHTWAITKSYEEATAIVQRLNGHWTSLD